ncbi:MAG: hypothetical protein ACLUEV_00340 [Alistipes sp.]
MEYFIKPLTPRNLPLFPPHRNELADFGYGAYAVERKTDGKFGFTSLHRPFKRTSLRESRSPGS